MDGKNYQIYGRIFTPGEDENSEKVCISVIPVLYDFGLPLKNVNFYFLRLINNLYLTKDVQASPSAHRRELSESPSKHA